MSEKPTEIKINGLYDLPQVKNNLVGINAEIERLTRSGVQGEDSENFIFAEIFGVLENLPNGCQLILTSEDESGDSYPVLAMSSPVNGCSIVLNSKEKECEVRHYDDLRHLVAATAVLILGKLNNSDKRYHVEVGSTDIFYDPIYS